MAANTVPRSNFLKQTYDDFAQDDCPTMASSLAYYTIFSLPPLLVIVISIAGLVWGADRSRARVDQELQGVVGQAGVQQLDTMMDAAAKQGRGIVATITGIVVLLFGATGVVAQLQCALNRVWGVKPDPKSGGVLQFIRKRILSFGMILAVAFLLTVSLVFTALLAAFGDQMSSWLPENVSKGMLLAANFAVSFVVIAALFAAMFKFLPDGNIRWRDVAVGSCVTALLFLIGKFLIGFYLGRQAPGAYGPAAALVLILVWVYYSAMIFFFGAEFTKVWAERFGRRIVPAPGAVRSDESAAASPPSGHPELQRA